MKISHYIIYIKLFFVMIFWGSAFVSGRMITQNHDPFVVAFMRFSMASMILIPFLYFKERKIFPKSLKSYLKFSLLGLSGVFSYNYFFLSGLKLVEAGRSSVIIALNPALTALFSYLIFREKLTLKAFVGILIAFLGTLIVLSRGDFQALFQGQIGRGELYLLCAVLSWITYTLSGKKILRKISVYQSTTWACVLGALFLLPFALSNGLMQSLNTVSAVDFLNVVNLGVFSTCISFIWFYQGVIELGASKTSSFINLLPLVGVSSGILILGERPDVTLFIGGFIVLLGIFLVTKKNHDAK